MNYLPTINTVCNIETLLWYYIHPEPHPKADNCNIRSAITTLRSHGLLRRAYGKDSGYQITRKGAFMIKMLCDTPYPNETYEDPRKAV